MKYMRVNKRHGVWFGDRCHGDKEFMTAQSRAFNPQHDEAAFARLQEETRYIVRSVTNAIEPQPGDVLSHDDVEAFVSDRGWTVRITD